MKFLIPLLFSIVLIGCAGTVPNTIKETPQEAAGITTFKVKGCQVTDSSGNTLDYTVCDIDFKDGKEGQGVKMSGEWPTEQGVIKINYEAEELRAFDGQVARAVVHQAIVNANKEAQLGIADAAIPGIVDVILKAIGTP